MSIVHVYYRDLHYGHRRQRQMCIRDRPGGRESSLFSLTHFPFNFLHPHNFTSLFPAPVHIPHLIPFALIRFPFDPIHSDKCPIILSSPWQIRMFILFGLKLPPPYSIHPGLTNSHFYSLRPHSFPILFHSPSQIPILRIPCILLSHHFRPEKRRFHHLIPFLPRLVPKP